MEDHLKFMFFGSVKQTAVAVPIQLPVGLQKAENHTPHSQRCELTEGGQQRCSSVIPRKKIHPIAKHRHHRGPRAKCRCNNFELGRQTV